jgi:formate hydrogenlyase transcriptional activator
MKKAPPTMVCSMDELLQILRRMTAAATLTQAVPMFETWAHSYIPFDFLGCVLWKGEVEEEADRDKSRIEIGEKGHWSAKEPALCSLDDIAKDFPLTAGRMKRARIQSCCVAGLFWAENSFGVLIFGGKEPDSFSASARQEIGRAAEIVSFALMHLIFAENVRRDQVVMAQDRNRLQVVRQVTEAVVSELDLRKLLYKVSESIQTILKIEYSDLLLFNPAKGMMRRLAVSFEGKGLMKEDDDEPLSNSPAHRAFTLRQPVVSNRAEMEELAAEVGAMRSLLEEGLQTTCSIPLLIKGKVLGTLNACSSEAGKFTPECVALLSEISRPIAVAVDNALAYREISELRDQLAREKEYLQEEIHTNWRFEEIVGESASLMAVLEQVQMVADSDANVLILGETGTGKELIARALHDLSGRKDRTFVKFNCAAMPAGLLESELFGHERGAFTGAAAAKAGLMEVANRGTLFLDEVGDLPLEVQPKLLRVLQEQQFLRLGSTRTIQVDVRVIAATNRDLKQMIAERQFRNDLFYRLNVIPLYIPPLRERREDIPLLVRYFVRKYAQIRKRRVESVPAETMQALMQWDWPGNIRELENLIERAVIMSKGPVLNIPPGSLQGELPVPRVVQPVREPEPEQSAEWSAEEIALRESILAALKRHHGVVAGPNGAAASLGMKRTTLLWKMRRLGITMKHEYR